MWYFVVLSVWGRREEEEEEEADDDDACLYVFLCRHMPGARWKEPIKDRI